MKSRKNSGRQKAKANIWIRFSQHVRDHRWFYTVSGLALLVYVVFSYLSYRKFMYPMLDLGLFNRHMWGMVRGDFGPLS